MEFTEHRQFFSIAGLQPQFFHGSLFYPGLGIIDGEIFIVSPQLKKVFVKRTVRITRLPRRVDAQRFLPVLSIYNDFKGTAGGVVVPVGIGGRGITIATPRKGSRIEFLSPFFVYRRT